MRRRQLLGLVSLLMLPLRLWSANRPPTPAQTEGPFYPVEPIPVRDTLIGDETSLVGEVMALAGKVLNQQGEALAGARIEIWQCDGNGRYAHPAQTGHEKFDPGFLGYGAQITDEQGGFRFVTLYPVPYTGRPPHIHVKIHQADEEVLTTQLYLKGNSSGRNGKALQIDPVAQSDGLTTARFDFVI